MGNRGVNANSQESPPPLGRRAGASPAASELDLAAALDAIEARGLRRQLRHVEGLPGPRMRVDGRSVLMLAGANYLDLAGDPRVLAAAREAIDTHGTTAGGARLIAGNLPLHTDLETRLGRFAGHAHALLFSTGYMANLGVLTALCGPGDVIVSDALNHASIIDACRLSGAETRVFHHNDPEDFERVAKALPASGRRVLITDGVYSMDGDVARLRELVPIARHHDMHVVLDDAHGFGVLGPRGRGTAELEGVEVDALIGNLGKALGSFGGFVACSETLREWLIHRARSFIFTCALAPSNVAAARAALEIVAAEPERRARVLARAAQLRNGLEQAGLSTFGSTHIVPLLVGAPDRAMQLCERALEHGVYAQGIRYPSVARDAARLRLTPTCAHDPADIDRCVALLVRLCRELPDGPRAGARA